MLKSVTMTVSTQTDLLLALADPKNHDAILGTAECEWLDFKRDLYDLDRPKGKRSLVADVAAFANNVGGVVLLGVRAAKDETTRDERAVEFCPIRIDLVDTERIMKIVRQHVRPLPRFDVKRFPHHGQGDLVAIIVGAQNDLDKPFVVDLVAGADDKEIPHAVGWPVRSGADTHWQSVDYIQQRISAGVRAGTPQLPPSRSAIDDDLVAHLKMLEDASDDWEEWGLLVVQAIPDASSEVQDFYGAFFDTMRHWKNVRDGGFGVHLDWGIEKEGDHLVAATSGQYVAISRRGVITAAVVGSPDSLGWAQNGDDGDPAVVKVSPYMLVEFPAEVVRLAEDGVGPALLPAGWTFRVIGRRFRSPRPLLQSMRARDTWLGSWHEPIADNFERDVPASGDVWRDAFDVVAEIVASGWGQPSTNIPFTAEGRVDLDSMRR